MNDKKSSVIDFTSRVNSISDKKALLDFSSEVVAETLLEITQEINNLLWFMSYLDKENEIKSNDIFKEIARRTSEEEYLDLFDFMTRHSNNMQNVAKAMGEYLNKSSKGTATIKLDTKKYKGKHNRGRKYLVDKVIDKKIKDVLKEAMNKTDRSK